MKKVALIILIIAMICTIIGLIMFNPDNNPNTIIDNNDINICIHEELTN